MKTITINLRTVLFAALTLLALVCFAPAGKAHQLRPAGYPAANGFTQAVSPAKAHAESKTVAKPGQKKTKKQKAEKRNTHLSQGGGCMDFLFIGWGH